MNTNRRLAAPLAAGSLLMLLLPGVAAFSQDAAAPPPAPTDVTGGPPPAAPITDTRTGRPLRSVAGEMGRLAGAIVLADSSVSAAPVLMPGGATTADNLPAQLDALVRLLPPGTVWGKVYLPVTGSGSSLDADAVSQYIVGQARLFGTVGAAPAGKVEIMGQRLTPDQAAPVIAALNLKPVYLITNPRAAPTSAIGANFAQMSPAERAQYAQQQAQAILSGGDPGAAQQYLQEQAEVMRALMQQLTPDQRQQLMAQIRGPRGGGAQGGGQYGNGGGALGDANQ
jgi:uncharacterized protein YmfQ (DUF2313 family)